MEWITAVDIRILFFLHQLASPALDSFIAYFTRIINFPGLWLALAVIGLWRKSSRQLTLTVILAVFLAICIGDLGLKHVVMRLRPYLVIPDAPTLDALVYPVTNSFPSGHSFFSFAGATVFFHYRRKLGCLIYLFAILVAFSRLYLFMHFPSDVCIGAFFGLIIGNLACILEPKLTQKSLQLITKKRA